LPNRRPSRRPLRWLVSGLLAIGAHGLLLAALLLLGALEPTIPTIAAMPSAESPAATEPEQPMEIASLVEALDRPAELTAAEKKQKAEEERKDKAGQVVDIAKPAIELHPDSARFLAEHDSTVAHETKGAVGKGQAGAPQAAAPPPLPTVASRPAGGGPQGPVLAMRGPLGTKVPSPAGPPSEVENIGPDGNLAHSNPNSPLKPPDRPGGSAPPGSAVTPNLLPSAHALAQALGMGAGSPDYLDDVEASDSTGLNAKKWKFAAFFNRIKRAVADEWHPDELLGRHDPSGNIYGAQDRTTMLKVQLRPDGTVGELKVARGSGVEFLDDEAMSAFRRAQPFENPPPGLVDSDGFIRFNFGFIVQLSGRTSFKFYKYSKE
jgi:TonB family protein